MMNVSWYAHLPSVAVVESPQIPIGPGHLVHLPFAEWYQLDQGFEWCERQYQVSSPVFYNSQLEMNGLKDGSEVTTAILEKLHHLHLAFLLSPHLPRLPSPVLSMIYICIPPTSKAQQDAGILGMTQRLAGPVERDWIIYGNPFQYTFDEAALVGVSRTWDQVTALSLEDAPAGVSGGIDTLVRTTVPEFSWANPIPNQVNDFVHCMAALEHILLPPREETPQDMKLTPTFGRHAGLLISTSDAELSSLSEYFSQMYRLRSKLVHGEIGVQDVPETDRQHFVIARAVLRDVLLHANALRPLIAGHRSLPWLLAAAYDNPDLRHSIWDRRPAKQGEMA